MIRINLLEETRVQAKAKGGGISLPKIQVAENVPVVMLLAGIALAVVGVFFGWFLYAAQIRNLQAEIVEKEKERTRLEFVLKQSEELNRKKADLNRKIGIISTLKSKQTVPVTLLDQLSWALADHVWLDELNYANDTVTLKGKASTQIAYANFLRNLEESKFFTSVANLKVDNQKGLTEFQASMTFRPPAPPTPPGQEPATTTSAPDTTSGSPKKRR